MRRNMRKILLFSDERKILENTKLIIEGKYELIWYMYDSIKKMNILM